MGFTAGDRWEVPRRHTTPISYHYMARLSWFSRREIATFHMQNLCASYSRRVFVIDSILSSRIAANPFELSRLLRGSIVPLTHRPLAFLWSTKTASRRYGRQNKTDWSGEKTLFTHSAHFVEAISIQKGFAQTAIINHFTLKVSVSGRIPAVEAVRLNLRPPKKKQLGIISLNVEEETRIVDDMQIFLPRPKEHHSKVHLGRTRLHLSEAV